MNQSLTNPTLKIIGVIPSRYGSTRLPGKPLIQICEIEMVMHVYYRACMSEILTEVLVATDDKRIYDLIIRKGGRSMMTNKDHNNGTERAHEVSKELDGDVFVVINGDEPLLNPDHITVSVEALLQSGAEASILYNKFTKKQSPSDFKVVINNKMEIMYISRADIPFDHTNSLDYMYKAYHIMSFTNKSIDMYSRLEQTNLDRTESHELIRLLESGYKIQGAEVDSSAISVDNGPDLSRVRNMMVNDPFFHLYNSND